MNLSITIDDNDNPVFQTEGKLDFNELLKGAIDKKEIKTLFSEKISKVFDSIKLDNKKINTDIIKNINDIFEFKGLSKEFNKNLKTKFDSILSGIKVDSGLISNQIKSVFDFKDIKKDLDKKIKASIPLNAVDKIKIGKDSEIIAKTNNTTNLIKADDSIEKAQQFNILDISPSVEQKLTKAFKNSLSDLYKVQEESLRQQKYEYAEAQERQKEQDTLFTSEKDIQKDKIKSENLQDKNQPPKEKDKQKGFLESLFEKFSLAGAGGMMGVMASALKIPAGALKFATNPVTLLVAGLIWAVVDGIKGFFKADEWGTSKISAVIGSILGGTNSGIKGAMAGMGKWALIGAGIGSVFPVVGTLIGGLIGAVVGGVLGFIGGEKIAKFLDPMVKWFDDNILGGLKSLWNSLTGWWVNGLMPAIQKFKTDMEPVFDKIKNLFKNLQEDIDSIFNELKPAFEVISNTFSWIWDKLKIVFGWIGEKFGGAIILLFDNLGPAIESFVDTLSFIKDVVVETIKGAIKGIKSIGEFVGEMFNFFTEEKWKEYIPDWARKLFGIGKSQSEMGKDTSIEKSTIDKADRRITEIETEIQKLSVKDDVTDADREKIVDLTNQLQITKEAKQKAENRLAKIETKKAKDNIISISYDGKIIEQTQLSNSDKLETMGNSSVFSQEGGTLDKSFKNMTDIMNKQLVELSNLKSYFMKGFEGLIKINNEINNNLGNIAAISANSSKPPVTEKAPDGYIRDPIYEFRMRLREV